MLPHLVLLARINPHINMQNLNFNWRTNPNFAPLFKQADSAALSAFIETLIRKEFLDQQHAIDALIKVKDSNEQDILIHRQFVYNGNGQFIISDPREIGTMISKSIPVVADDLLNGEHYEIKIVQVREA